MGQCYEVFRLIETVRSQGTAEKTSYSIEAEQDVNHILDRLLAPFDRNCSELFANMNISFRNADWWPWAIVFLDDEYLIAEHIEEARGESRDILFTAYSVRPGTNIPAGSVPPVSILLFKNRAALEQVKDFSPLFGNCWEILKDRSPERTWVATLDPLPDKWTRRFVADEPKRVVVFPTGESIGDLAIADWNQGDSICWQPYGAAEGAVEIPAAKALQLSQDIYSFDVDKFFFDALLSLGDNDIQSLNLSGFQDGLFNFVGELVGLKELSMDWSYVYSSDFEGCSGLPQLERLSARCCEYLDGEFLSHLDCHSSLRYLDLTQTPIGDRGLLALSRFTKLKSVQLMGIGATDVGMSGFGSLRDLEYLDLSDNAITDNGMPSLASSAALEYLNLKKTRITDESFNIISSLRNLRKLDARDTAITDSGLRAIRQLRHLEEVDVTSTDVTGVGFAGFCDKACLRSLSLCLCPVTEDGLRTIGGISSLRHLDLSVTQLDVGWLRHLSQLNELETLELRGIQVGDGELRQLKRLPKLRHIST